MDKYIKYLPFGLISALSGKCLVNGVSFAEVAFLAVLSVLGCYMHFATKEKKFQILEQKYSDLEKRFETKSKEIDDVKNHLSGLKLASAIRPTASKF
jgi:hypothetical protein